MNILSLFDGISCARIALEKLEIPIENYFASEIDKYAIQVSTKKFPDIIHLGDIKKIDVKKLPKIDLIIGGSPCQDLSNSQKGMGLEGGKSRLFFEYVRLLKDINPRYFLLENVKNKWGMLMNETVGVGFIEINSGLFSAQSRPRYYWTNISFPEIPDKLDKLVLKDIIEKGGIDEKYYLNNDKVKSFISQNPEINTNITKDGILKVFTAPKDVINDHERQRRVYSLDSKSPTILARADTTKIYINNRIRKLTPVECERLQNIPDHYTQVCSNTQRYKMIGNGFNVNTIAHILKGIA
jgi:site-specific DNA-cytosine methylase